MKKHWNSYPEFPELGKVQAKPSLAPFPFPSPIFQRKIPLQAAHSPPCQVMSTLINVTQEKLRIPWSRTRTRKENPRGRTPGCRGSSRSRFFFWGGGCSEAASLRAHPEDAQVQLPPPPDPPSLAHIPGLPFPICQLPGPWEEPRQRSLGNGGSWEWRRCVGETPNSASGHSSAGPDPALRIFFFSPRFLKFYFHSQGCIFSSATSQGSSIQRGSGNSQRGTLGIYPVS